MHRTPAAALLVLLPSVGLAACTFSRTQSNAAFRTLDPTPIVVGESTMRDVLRAFGPPSGATTERIAGLESTVSFRYACADERAFTVLLPYIVVAPFKWGDKQDGTTLIVEFDERGVVLDMYRTRRRSVWRPFQSPKETECEFFRAPPEARS